MLTSFVVAMGLLQTHVKDLVVTDQPSAPLHLKVGQKLIFSVYENASTGATWAVKDPGKPGLKFLGMAEAKEKEQSPPKPGQGATLLISFQAAKKGNFKVTLIYGRTWEIKKGTKPWDQRSARVVVGP